MSGKISPGKGMDDYNNAAYEEYNEKALVPCNNCGRTFLPDSLVKHAKACDKAHGKAPGASPAKGPVAKGSAAKGPAAKGASPVRSGFGGGSAAPPPPPKMIMKPKAVMCYIW